MKAQSPIFTRVYALLAWLLPVAARLPRTQRSALARQLPDAAFLLQRQLLRAAKQPEQVLALLRDADAALSELRLLLRLGQELGAIPFAHYEAGSRHLDEIGRLLGGWQRAEQTRLTRAAAPVEQGSAEPP